MIRRIAFMAAIVVLFSVYAVQADVPFHNANQVTLAWDEVTIDVDGDAIEGVTYELLLANANTDPNKTNPVVVYEGAETQTTITLTKGRYYVGVRTVYAGDVSVINWGDEAEYQENVELFGVRFAVPPHAPKNLKTN